VVTSRSLLLVTAVRVATVDDPGGSPGLDPSTYVCVSRATSGVTPRTRDHHLGLSGEIDDLARMTPRVAF
jgi:hypothetical protein